MSGECEKCGEHALECICGGCYKDGLPRTSIVCPKCDGEFLIDPDPIFDPKTGEIYKKRKWMTKEEAKQFLPESKTHLNEIIKCLTCGHILISGSGMLAIFGQGISIECKKCGNKHVFDHIGG